MVVSLPPWKILPFLSFQMNQLTHTNHLIHVVSFPLQQALYAARESYHSCFTLPAGLKIWTQLIRDQPPYRHTWTAYEHRKTKCNTDSIGQVLHIISIPYYLGRAPLEQCLKFQKVGPKAARSVLVLYQYILFLKKWTSNQQIDLLLQYNKTQWWNIT